ncbi:Dimer Tnp hAT domain-containing protein [Aphis craccivora]|uniref:Dimer Tnp hAT domain-containing protein n=1 Tax=Aphis craccivora TaxID=307492 RepID=A0A6G0YGV7_APHCR|nr:Dimer Tnp hAT domain-containing protein [Aphis craccivora]
MNGSPSFVTGFISSKALCTPMARSLELARRIFLPVHLRLMHFQRVVPSNFRLTLYYVKQEITLSEDYKNIAKILNFKEVYAGRRVNVVEFSFVLPGSNAAVERVFSLMNGTWTNSRNKLDIKTVEATFIIKTCFNNKSCEVFYDQILRNKS